MLSMVLAEVRECIVDEVAEGMSQCMGGGKRTCRGEEDDDAERVVGWSAWSKKTPPRSCWGVICAGSVAAVGRTCAVESEERERGRERGGEREG